MYYIGVSFGLNPVLFRFWKENGFTPFYLCGRPNGSTGEHSCMMLKRLETTETGDGVGSLDFLNPFYQRFKREFMRKLHLCYKEIDYKLAISILDPKIKFLENETSLAGDKETFFVVNMICPPYELEIVEGYINNLNNYEQVKHFQRQMAYWYFQEKFPISLSHLQASLLCMVLQRHDLTYIEEQVKIGTQQILSVLRKVIVRFYKYVDATLTKEYDASLPRHRQVNLEPHSVIIEEDLEDGAKEVMEKMRLQAETGGKDERVGILNSESLQRYAIDGREVEMEQALRKCSKISESGILSVKSSQKTKTKRKKGLELNSQSPVEVKGRGHY